jgi:hypothetical protein
MIAITPFARFVGLAGLPAVVPAFAKAIGHEEKWKLHNGCS